MRRTLFQGRVATAIGLVLIASAVLAAVLVPPILLAFVILVAWLPRLASTPLPPHLVPAVVHDSPRLPRNPRGPPRS